MNPVSRHAIQFPAVVFHDRFHLQPKTLLFKARITKSVAILIGGTTSTTHAERIQLISVAITIGLRDVIASALVNGPRPVAHAALIVFADAQVGLITNQISILVCDAIALAVVSKTKCLLGVPAGVLIGIKSLRSVVAGLGIGTITCTRSLENELQIVGHRLPCGPSILNRNNPFSTPVQCRTGHINGRRVISTDSRRPIGWPSPSEARPQVGASSRGINVPSSPHNTVARRCVDVSQHVCRITAAPSRVGEVDGDTCETARQNDAFFKGLVSLECGHKFQAFSALGLHLSKC